MCLAVQLLTVVREPSVTPFMPASVPTRAIGIQVAGYVVVTLAIALLAFRRRPL